GASLDTALALVAQCGEPNVGVNFDVFHYYTGPSKFEDLQLLTLDSLAHVQLCDVAGVPRELATDADRILPGDGDFNLLPLLDHFRAVGYDGWVAPAMTVRLVRVQRSIRVLQTRRWDVAVERDFLARGGGALPDVTADYYRTRPLPFEPAHKLLELTSLERDVRGRLRTQSAPA